MTARDILVHRTTPATTCVLARFPNRVPKKIRTLNDEDARHTIRQDMLDPILIPHVLSDGVPRVLVVERTLKDAPRTARSGPRAFSKGGG